MEPDDATGVLPAAPYPSVQKNIEVEDVAPIRLEGGVDVVDLPRLKNLGLFAIVQDVNLVPRFKFCFDCVNHSCKSFHKGAGIPRMFQIFFT